MPVTRPEKIPAGGPAPIGRSQPPVGERRLTLSTAKDFATTTAESPSGLAARVTSDGALFALRHGNTLISQVMPGPAEDGLFRLILRWRSAGGSGWAPLVGPGCAVTQVGATALEWTSSPQSGLACRTLLALHPEKAAWAWRISLQNTSKAAVEFDVLLAQDLGLGDEGAVRNSEAFSSQYIDLLPVEDPQLGWVVLARQNLEMAGGCFPWLAAACADGAASYCTDGTQFFGSDHRLTGIPAAVGSPALPSRRVQGEAALAGLQSKVGSLKVGASADVVFLLRYNPDHREASGADDLAVVRELLPATWMPGMSKEPAPNASSGSSVFVRAPWLHGDAPSASDWETWFPGERRHVETAGDGSVLSFFSGAATHVVSRAKEADIARSHGHILRSGNWRWIDPDQFGTTCYAPGIFCTQAYLGNQSLARLLPVVRDGLGIGRAAGQRVFVKRSGDWHQLGVPSAFAMTPSDARWIYKIGSDVIEARTWCSRTLPASFLELKVMGGQRPFEFLVTHTLAMDANEFDHAGTVRLSAEDCWAACKPDPASLVGARIPGACFAIAAADAKGTTRMGGDELLYSDGASRAFSCVALESGSVPRLGVILCGSLGGPASLKGSVDAARREWRHGPDPSVPPAAPIRLSPAGGKPAAQSVARIDEILPWFVHNAAIHFSAPHGLEQHGGAAWGVRDVCQGSIEWLLTSGHWSLARRVLETVFQQQYAHEGGWPQWFMHPPFQSIRQADSHGDVCFWPVKALCDYVEASNDLEFFRWKTGYTDPKSFEAAGPAESLLQHCDRVIDLCESRFMPGTALVNYGDGDWDDTLRPADPEMRTRMVSSWTVGLAFHAFRQLAEAYRMLEEPVRLSRIRSLLSRMRRDFADKLMPGSVVAGFMVSENDGTLRPLLHPEDRVTGIRYRLLPMTRSVLAELFTRDEAARHMAIVHKELLYPDGARLMSEPAHYEGGRERLFKRADTAANVGREIGLQYVHAHLRYAEAMAKLGEADRLWTALQIVNPVALGAIVPNALPRQSNVYFSSSDADFGDRGVAESHWGDLKSGSVGVRGGWRLYSSGPGIFVRIVRTCLLGLRESYGDIVFDPVLPMGLDGLVAQVTLCGRPVTIDFQVKASTHSPTAVIVNGAVLKGGTHEANPYRPGGLRIRDTEVSSLLSSAGNSITVYL